MAPRPRPRDPAPAAVRKEVEEIMRSHKEGKHYKEAILRAGELAAKHGGSALVLNLVGELQKAMHRDSALVSFAAAAKLAPNCIDTAVSHASMLFESERYVEAQVELLRALAISDPVDPAEHNVGYGLCSDLTSAERLRDARARARNAMESFTTFICEEFVPTESIRVLDAIKLGREVAATAYDLAKGLATSFQFSGRAQFLRAYVYLKRVRGFDPAIDKRPFLRRTSRMLQDSVIAFRRSLVIALFHAKLLFVLGEYADAERACHRALAIESPDDPKEHDLPPGSVSGEEYDDRVSCVKNQLRTLIKKIIFVGASYSRLPSYEKEDSLMSVKVKPLLELCNATDKSLAKTITDALRFFKKNNSWSFWICPLSARCDGRKFVDTPSLWKHLCSKHPERLWGKLESILGPKLCESERDCFALEWITFSQDQDQHDIFRLVKMDGMFDSLIRRAYVGAEPNLVEMRTDKCREGAEILEGIKRRLGALPADISSSQFDDARSGIQNMWLNFLKISVLDYREFMYPVVISIVWAKLKKGMTDNPNIVGHISDSKIDSIFDDAPSAYGCNVSEGHDSDPSDANKMGTTRKQNLKVYPLHSNRTLKADGDHQESELCFEDGNSMVKPPNDTEGKEMEIDEIVANVERNELEIVEILSKLERSLELEVTCGQSAEEMANTNSYRSVAVVNEETTDKDLFIYQIIIQSLWNLRLFRDGVLRSKPVCILIINVHCLIAELMYGIFFAWGKDEHDGVPTLLASVKDIVWKIANDDMFQKLQAGKNFVLEVVATILQGLHVSAASLHFDFHNEIEGREVSPIHVETSCRCGKSFDEKKHTTVFYRLDASSPQKTKIKSLAELPVLYDEQLCFEDNCQYCGSPKNVDVSPLNAPHFFTIGLEWFGSCESQVQLSEVLVCFAHPVDIKLLCKGSHLSANYSLASMISYADGRYVCFARHHDKWLICDAQTVEAVDSWEQLLERFRDCRLQPEVLFFEIIK